MSSFILRDRTFDAAKPETLNHHRGNPEGRIRQHEKDVREAWKNGLDGIKVLARHLFRDIADASTLRVAWDHLEAKGGIAPGPNGRTYRDFTNEETWNACRGLALAIRSGCYRPGPERILEIAKASGNGYRPISLMNIEDRVVQRGIFIILEPILDRLLDERCLGYRPKVDRRHALAMAMDLTLSERRRVWVAEDIRDAFTHVPLSRMLQIVEKLLPAPDLMELLARVMPSKQLPGLRQGGSLSSLLLNVYLNHFVDRPWRQQQPRTPMIRVSDDLLVLCRTQHEAELARDELAALLQPAGMTLKGTRESSICDLRGGHAADWLGFTIREAPDGLSVEIAAQSWTRLEQHLELAHTKSDSPRRANHIIKQWLSQQGPCFGSSDHEEVCRKIASRAHEQRFTEIPGVSKLIGRWQRAWARWRKLQKSMRTIDGVREWHHFRA